ncbi:asialoglycoprotein receptor 1-like [Pseudophryne corroboree]|uniref:asialoglycoprotein receptor 1-like n=1 Tax=Pseudophryne corroboree TaxID=495146 RepID=UPI003081345B
MSKDYQDLQFLQNAPGESADFKMNPWVSQPSSRLQYVVHTIYGGLLLLIIILVISFRNPGEKPADRTLEFQIGNLSERINSKVAQLSQDGAKVMERLQPMDKALKNIQTDSSISALQSGMQKVLNSLSRLTERIKRLDVNGSKEETCPATWSKFLLSCYFFSSEGKSWNDSEKSCQEKNSHMVVINSNEEQRFVFSITKGKYTWIGLTDMTGEWKWVDGTNYDAAPKNWIPGQPDDFYGHGLGGGEDCAHLHNNGKWNDDHCTRPYLYLCEMDL